MKQTDTEKQKARYEQGRESVQRAKTGRGAANDQRVIDGFLARGILATPRVDVFTYRGWQSLGRQVQKGEKAVKIEVWIPINAKGAKPDPKTGEKPKSMRRKITSVFHKSQTEPIEG